MTPHGSKGDVADKRRAALSIFQLGKDIPYAPCVGDLPPMPGGMFNEHGMHPDHPAPFPVVRRG